MFDYSKTPFVVYYDLEQRVWVPMRNGRFATYDEAKELYGDVAWYMYQINGGTMDEE